jgi:uncharacterized protein (TIGR02099 family)
MSQARRRLRSLRRWTGYGLLVLLILCALGVGMLSRLLPLVEEHPERIAAWLSERVGAPVAFDRARAEWTRRGPRIQLSGLRVGAGAQMLRIDHAELLVAIYSGLLPNSPLTELKVRDLALNLRQGADGRWQLEGLPFRGEGDPLDVLQGFGELQIEKALLRIESHDGRLRADLARADLRLRVWPDRLLVGAQLWARRPGEPLTAVLRLQRGSFSGDGWIGGEDMSAEAWQSWLSGAPVRTAEGEGSLDLWFDLRDRAVVRLRARAEFENLSLQRPEGTQAPVRFEQLEFDAGWRRLDAGWQFDLVSLRARAPDAEQDAQVGALSLRGGDRFALRGEAIELGPLLALASLAEQVPAGLRDWLGEARPGGSIRRIELQGRRGPNPRWRGYAHVRDLAWSPAGRSPGLDGLSGPVRFDQDGGALRLDQTRHRFEWSALRQVEQFGLDATVVWWRDGTGWRVGTPDLRLQGAGYGARARGSLHLQGDGSRPWLDLAVDLDEADFDAAKRFWIIDRMSPQAVRWLDQALVQGRVREGRAAIAGDLDDWPFREHRGRFDARATVSGSIRYAEGWPRAGQAELRVAFDGPGMQVQGSGRIAGATIDSVAGGIEDFSRGRRLVLDIRSQSRAQDLLALLRQSPLQRSHGEHLRSATVEGDARTQLALDVPLGRDSGPNTVTGQVELARGRLRDSRWPIEFTDAQGRVDFSNHGFAIERMRVLLDQAPGEFSLWVGSPAGDPALAARAELAGHWPARALLARYPRLQWIESYLEGSADWRVGLQVPATEAGAPAVPVLSIASDLRGLELGLPAPLAKPAGEALALRVDSQMRERGGTVDLQLGERMSFRGLVNGDAPMDGNLVFGARAAAPQAGGGLRAAGAPATLDLAGWIGVISAGRSGEASNWRALDLQAGQLDLFGRPMPQVRLLMDRSGSMTRLRLSGEAIEGQVNVPDARDAAVVGRFARLHWPSPPAPPADAVPTATNVPAASAATGAPPVPAPDTAIAAGNGPGASATGADSASPSTDPAAIPALDFRIEDLRYGSARLGQAELQTRPLADGLRIERLSTRSRALTLDASGDWRRSGAAATRSQLDMQFKAESLGDMLETLGFAGMVDDGPTEARLQGSWPGSPAAFSLADLEGQLHLEVGEGRLLQVEPGGSGRLLGLVSLAEIPRRLTLDFSDFFQSGFGFNTLRGDLRFSNGNAETDNLRINGPAAEIRVSGRTDLRLRQYDQRIEVLPKAGGVLPAIGAVAGGPVGAAVGAVAQAILNRPMREGARTVYRVTGPWSAPVVETIERGARPRSRDEAAPGTPPAPESPPPTGDGP